MIVVQMASILHAIINNALIRVLEIGKLTVAQVISLETACDRMQKYLYQVYINMEQYHFFQYFGKSFW